MKKLLVNFIGIVSPSLLLTVGTAMAQTPIVPLEMSSRPAWVFNWAGRSDVSICQLANGLCHTGKMPPALGAVSVVVEGNFVAPVRSSWIALAKKQSAVCAFPIESQEVVCVRVGAPLIETTVSYLEPEGAGGRGILMYVAKPSSKIPRETHNAMVKKFSAALEIATAELQELIDVPSAQPVMPGVGPDRARGWR